MHQFMHPFIHAPTMHAPDGGDEVFEGDAGSEFLAVQGGGDVEAEDAVAGELQGWSGLLFLLLSLLL